MGFQDARIAQLPRWLRGAEGEAYQRAFGGQEDETVDLAKTASKVRYPWPAGPLDALEQQGAERRILPAPGEAPEAFAERLRRAPELWYWAGVPSGVANVFEPYFVSQGFVPCSGEARRLADGSIVQVHTPCDPAGLVQVSDYGTLGGPWWHGGDGAHPWWSKVVIVVDSREGPWTSFGTWGEADSAGTTWGDLEGLQYLWGSTVTERDLAYMRRMMRRWKAAASYPLYVAVVLSAEVKGIWGFSPPGAETWGELDGAGATWGTDEGAEVVFLRMFATPADYVLWGLPEPTWGTPQPSDAFLGEVYPGDG